MTLDEAIEKARNLKGSEPLYEIISLLLDIVETSALLPIEHEDWLEYYKFKDAIDCFIEFMEQFE